MKTAVEWLVEQMRLRRDVGLSLSFYDLEMFAKKAKAMEKEQIIQAHNHGYWEGDDANGDDEKYYNETYKNSNDEMD